MKNLNNFKNEIMATIPEVRRALKLKREANKKIAEIEKMIKNSYCENRYHENLKNFETYKVIEKACNSIVDITSNSGLKELAQKLSFRFYGYNDEALKTYFNRLKMVKNLTLNDVLDQVTDHVRIDSYYKSQYMRNNNKIKYTMDRCYGGMEWHKIFNVMLNFIQLYEIAINGDIADKAILEKLHEATCKNKLDQVQYKNIKIKVFQNGNYEITFADKTELEKVFNAINETVERRNRSNKS